MATDDRQPAVITLTRAGVRQGSRLARALGAALAVPARFATDVSDAVPSVYDDSVLAEVRRRWSQHPALVLVMASGVAVRAIATLVGDKASDPAVVCVDEAGQWAIPLLGGHLAGANALAQRIAALTGGAAAVTTASDVQSKPALDLLGREDGWRIAPGSALTHTSACLVNGDPIGLYVDPALPAIRRAAVEQLAGVDNVTPLESLDALEDAGWAAGLIVSHRRSDERLERLLAKSVLYRPPALVVGMGCRRGVPATELRAALETALGNLGLALESVEALATVDLKGDEPGLRQLAAELGVPLRTVAGEQLAALDSSAFSPSAARTKLDLPGVAEPCALLVAGGPLLLPKRSFARCTVAVALRTDDRRPPTDDQRPALKISGQRSVASGRLSLIGIGPGDLHQMTSAAAEALRAAELVIGYQGYIDQVRALLSPEQQIIASPIGSEIARAEQAIELAAGGRRVAVISSGDIGIYAMAGPAFETLRQRGWKGTAPEVQVFPGVSAVQAAAARLGAPLNHDFCTISLSDLLTPWEIIERRIWAAARGDFVIAFYNPRSRDRDWQLDRAVAIVRTYRSPSTPIAAIRNVTRPDETITLTSLADFDPTSVDMFTLVLVGNSQSFTVAGHMATPRGYRVERVHRGEDATGAELGCQEATHLQAFASAPQTDTYPITLTHMHGALAVVVGGGRVGERKVQGLLRVGGLVRVISPEVTEPLRSLANVGSIRWVARPYQTGDLDDYPRLVFAATAMHDVNAQVARDAAAYGLLCNVADSSDAGSFHLPAVYRQVGVVLAVSTDGDSPARARELRNRIGAWLEEGGLSENERR